MFSVCGNGVTLHGMKVSIGNVKLPVKSNASANSAGLNGLHSSAAAPRNAAIPRSPKTPRVRTLLGRQRRQAFHESLVSHRADHAFAMRPRPYRDRLNFTPRRLPKR